MRAFLSASVWLGSVSRLVRLSGCMIVEMLWTWVIAIGPVRPYIRIVRCYAARNFGPCGLGNASRATLCLTCLRLYVVALRRTVHYVVAEAAKAAGIEFPVHPHMLRPTPRGFIWRMPARTHALSSFTSGTGTFSIWFAIRNWRLDGSKNFGRTDRF
jgi:hypothetical protein